MKEKWKLGKLTIDIPGCKEEKYVVLYNYGWPFGYHEINTELRFEKRKDAEEIVEKLRMNEKKKHSIVIEELE